MWIRAQSFDGGYQCPKANTLPCCAKCLKRFPSESSGRVSLALQLPRIVGRGHDEHSGRNHVAVSRYLCRSRPNSHKDVGRICHRYPLRDELPADLRHDSRLGLRPLVRPKRIEVRALVRQSCVRFGTTVKGGAICGRKGSCCRRAFE